MKTHFSDSNCNSKTIFQQHPPRSARAKRNLRLVMFESAITAGILSMSIFTPFMQSIGLSQLEISLTQIIFTLAVIVLDLPMGWLADCFSRKWANVIGDFGCALMFLCYAFANNFWTVVLCETGLGIFRALSQGVDQALLRHFCGQIDSRETYFERQTARLLSWRHACILIVVALGGPIGAISFRLAIALTGVPSLLGGLASLVLVDDSRKLQSQQNVLQGSWRIARQSFQNPDLRWRLFAFAVTREMTHVVIWIFTPLLMLAGLPLSIVSIAWAFNSATAIIGARLAARYAARLNDARKFLLPLLTVAGVMLVLAFHLNYYTVWLYLLMGVAQGWVSATMTPPIQQRAIPEEQTSVLSLASTLSRLLYIPSTLLVGWVADRSLTGALLANTALFLPLGLFIASRLSRR